MNNPNPNTPPSPLADQITRSRSRLKVAFYTLVGVPAVVVMLALCMQGCKREQPADDNSSSTSNVDTNPPPIAADTNATAMASTNMPAPTAPQPPPAPPTPPPPAEPTTQDYVVVKGDSFYSIGKKYGVTIKAISEANPGVDSTKLKIGQKLTIPASSGTPAAAGGATADTSSSDENIYVVKSGDTLSKIAKLNGTTYKAIKALNNLTTDKIKVGQKLKIPVKGEATPAPAAQPAPATDTAPMTTQPEQPASAPASNPAPATTPAPAGGQ